MPYAAINNVDLYYEIHGKGAPLMLIAGLASDSQSWQPIIRDLSKHYLVVSVDNRGAGRTKPQNAGTSITQIADDCAELIQYLGLPSVNLLGHSMGGFVALDIAIRYPEYLSKLILAGTAACNSHRNNALFSDWASHLETGMNPELWFRNIFYWIFSERLFENEADVNEMLRYNIDYPYHQSALAFRNQVNAIASYDCAEDLPKIAVKSMVICGEKDLLFPTDVCTRLAQAMPSSTISVIGNAAHSIHMEQPRAFTECVLDFLSQH
jgi:pimeloyl-ACP methyl ester carboxylesterase